MTAEVTVEQNNSNSTIYDGALSGNVTINNTSYPRSFVVVPGATTAPPIGTPFLIGTAGDIDALILSIYRGTDLVPLVGMTVVEQNGATITLAAGTQVIAMEDEIGQPQCDFDYNDAIWVLQVQQVPPAVTGISPVSGPWVGGTSVTITGSGFSGATAVDFGTTAASSFTVNSAGTQITATSPAEAAGTVDVTVTTGSGTSATSAADQFTYLPMNTATTLVSSQNPATAGQSVKLTATVTPANATGNVTFLDGGVGIGSEPQPLTVTEGDSLGFNQPGPSYVTVDPSASLDSLGGNSQLTLSMWVYPTADMGNSGILYKGPFDGSQGSMSVIFGQVGSNCNLVHFRLNGAVTEAGEVIANSPIPDNQWTFITCTYNGSEEDIYINGVLNASASYSAPLQSDSCPLYIGGYYSPGYSFQGNIDEVGIWNQALDNGTISQLYDDGVGEYGLASQSPWNQNFIAGYHFDEGSGDSVYDYSGNGNTGTFPSDAVSWETGSTVADTEQVSITVSTLGVGANSITAVYSGDGNGAAATSAASQVLVLPTSLASTVVNDPVNQASPSPLTDWQPGPAVRHGRACLCERGRQPQPYRLRGRHNLAQLQQRQRQRAAERGGGPGDPRRQRQPERDHLL